MAVVREQFYFPVYDRATTGSGGEWSDLIAVCATDATGGPCIYIDASQTKVGYCLSVEESKLMEEEVRKAISDAAQKEVSRQLKALTSQAEKLKQEIQTLEKQKDSLKKECKGIVAEVKQRLAEIERVAEEQRQRVMRFAHLEMD
jgi:hypothetical protein